MNNDCYRAYQSISTTRITPSKSDSLWFVSISGTMTFASFVGPEAEEWAKEYAAFKNGEFNEL